ncbi:MAG: hypothetical protein ACK4IK_01795 [Bacteroidia bacterium]
MCLLIGLISTKSILAQQSPTGSAGNSQEWRRGGNIAAPPGLGGTNNIFGTMWDSPVYI